MLHAESYGTIVADPAWPYKTPGKIGASLMHRPNRDMTSVAGTAGSVSRYGKMSIEEICRLQPRAADNAHLYIWFTNKFAVEAHTIADAWGFRQITILTWTKITKAEGRPSMKMGRYFRGATEHVLFCVRGSQKLLAAAPLPTAFLWPREKRHSQKPAAFFDMVQEASPGPYLEMFARGPRAGWAVWGNQAHEEARTVCEPVKICPECREEYVPGIPNGCEHLECPIVEDDDPIDVED
jgi:N6-adenosine-specific RNA methylase IME4